MISSQSSLKRGQHQTTTNSSGAPNLDQWTFSTDWRKDVTAGSLVRGNFRDPNPWSYTIKERTDVCGHIYRRANSSTNLSSITYDGWLSDLTAFTGYDSLVSERDACYNACLSRLNEKVRGSLDLATSLAETGQSVKMLNLVRRFKSGVADMAKSYNREVAGKLRATRSRTVAAKALSRWQKGLRARYPGHYRPIPSNPGLVSRVTSLGANGWCEYTYGWSPLISDIRGVAENVVGFVRNHNRIRASYTLKIDSKSRLTYGVNGVQMPFNIARSGFIKTTIGVKLDSGWDESLAKWSSLNPLTVAWELVPYSFVVDWFLDVGNYMRDFETSLLYQHKFHGGFKSVLVKYSKAVQSQGAGVFGTEVQDWVASAALSETSFSRTLISSYPAPHLPSFKLDLGANQLISAAALLRQLLR